MLLVFPLNHSWKGTALDPDLGPNQFHLWHPWKHPWTAGVRPRSNGPGTLLCVEVFDLWRKSCTMARTDIASKLKFILCIIPWNYHKIIKPNPTEGSFKIHWVHNPQKLWLPWLLAWPTEALPHGGGHCRPPNAELFDLEHCEQTPCTDKAASSSSLLRPWPFLSLISTAAPCPRRSSATLPCPLATALCNGVAPWQVGNWSCDDLIARLTGQNMDFFHFDVSSENTFRDSHEPHP